MFRQQTVILETLPTLKALFGRYERPVGELASIENDTRDFVVRVPLVGAFSSGKSSLLNAFMEEPLFATDITAETGVPAELRHGERESYTGHLPGGGSISLTREQVSENRLDILRPDGWVRVTLALPQLATISHLCLVDMPGWDSGIEGHKRAIDGYVDRSLAYCIIADAARGCLGQSIHNALNELALHGLPIVLVVTMIDDRSGTALDDVVKQIAAEVEGIIKRPLLAIARVSAHEDDIGQFAAALQKLDGLAEPLFASQVASRLEASVTEVKSYLKHLANRDDQGSEALGAEIDRHETVMRNFETALAEETAALESRVEPLLDKIMQRVESRLQSQLESLAGTALQGGEISPDIEAAIRIAATQGLQQDFAPEMKRYISRVTEAFPLSIRTSVHVPEKEAGPSNAAEVIAITGAATAATPWLAGLTAGIPLVGPFLAPAVRFIVPLLAALLSSRQKKVEEAERREEVRQQIRGSAIPGAVAQTRLAVEQLLRDKIDEAHRIIAERAQTERQSITAALTLARENLARSQADYDALRRQYAEDCAVLDNVLARLAVEWPALGNAA